MGKSIDRANRWLCRGVVASVLAVAAAGGGDALGHRFCDFSFEPKYTSKPLEEPFVLATIKVSPDRPLYYAVVLTPCGERRCPIEVRLRDDREVYDVRKVDVCGVAEEPRSSEYDSLSGVGDPLEPDTGLSVWLTGYEQFALFIFARPIDLAPGLRGVLLFLSGAEEHTWRRHYLFVAQGKTLTLPWKADEVGGEDIAAVDLKDIDGDGSLEILLFFGAPYGEFVEPGAQLGTVGASVYRWNEAREKVDPLRLSEAGVPIYAAIAGMYDSVGEAADAVKKLEESSSCIYTYYLLRTDDFPQFQRGKLLLAKFTWRKSLAEAEHRACNPAGRGFVAELIFFPEVIGSATLPD